MAPDSKAFKEALSRFASGVTVVTTLHEARPYGLTVSAFCSVSVQPPRVLVCLSHASNTQPLIERSGCFAVHILGRDTAQLGLRFANLLPGVDDPFYGLDYDSAITGAPILRDCLAWLDCTVDAAHPAGDHTLFVGAVKALYHSDAVGEPVLYFQRAFRTLDPEPLAP
jgi:flavin reductase (DIM6/NTAB) family NADH-FMN oxidoreductase RutF